MKTDRKISGGALGRFCRAPMVAVAAVSLLVLASCTGAAEALPGEQSAPSPTATAGPAKGGVDQGGRNLAGQGAESDTIGKAEPVTAAVPDPTKNYQWVGTVIVSDLEGKHIELDRGCDKWVLLAESPEVMKRLEENVGNKILVWGKVHQGPTIYQKNVLDAQAAFGPNDPRPMTLIAVPDYPCPGTPKPPVPAPVTDNVQLQSGEAAIRGQMRWENGTPMLITAAGTVALVLPPRPATAPETRSDMPRSPTAGEGAAKAGSVEAAPLPPENMEVVAVGRWVPKGTSLTLQARVVRPWPMGISVSVACSSRMVSVQLQPGEMAAAGSIVRDGDRRYLKTESGPIVLFVPMTPEQSPEGDAVVTGHWKLAPEGLTMSVRSVVSRGQKCPPPPPAQPPLQAGEIAARGTLGRENGKAWLTTPAGKIVLVMPTATAQDGAIGQPPNPPSNEKDAVASNSDITVTGKWSIENGQLVINVRSLQGA